MVSLDGVVEAPETWTGPYMGPDLGQEVGSTMSQADAMLLGRKTYETFAASFADQSGGMADVMNRTPKFVASTTLEEATWQSSTLLKGDLAAELKRLKEQDGKNINISGSATLIRSLLRDGLLDELRLLQFPVVLGSGARLFDGYGEQLGLTLADSHAFATGVVNLVYRPTTA
jgi:dihydrofolate reductase